MVEKSLIPLLIFAAGTLLAAKGATRWAFHRIALLLVLGITIAVWGALSAWHLPVELMPNTASETVTVTVNVRGGMSPQDVETLICRPLEDTLGDLSRLENMVSSARKDRGVVSLQLEPGSDMKSATAEVHARLERVMNKLPAEIEKPVVAHYEESDAPVFMAAFTSDRQTPEEMRRLIETRFKDRLQRVSGVANVELGGGRESKILVEVDRDRLSAFRLSINQIVHRLGRRNVTTQVGTLSGQERSAAVRISGTLAGVEDMKRLPIGRDPNGGMVLLGQVAEVTDSYMEAESLSRLNGRAAVSIYIQKESSANTLHTAREVERAMDAAWKELPPDQRQSIQKVVVSNQAETIQASLESVRMSLLSGVLLIVLVIASFQSKTAITRRRGRWGLGLLLGTLVVASVFSVNQARLEVPLVVFLLVLVGMAVWDKDLRPAFVVGGSVPASALISFILFRMCGLSINVMSLFGLALGMGMLVDNAIVVYENILHNRELTGPVADPAAQAMEATEQMVMPMIGATVTNAVTFLPFLFLSKSLQLMYWDVAAAVGASHFASILVSLTVVPILSLKLLESKNIKPRQSYAFKWHPVHFKNFFPLLAGEGRVRDWIGGGWKSAAKGLRALWTRWAKPIQHSAPTAITFIALLLLGLMIFGWKGPTKWTYALIATLATGVGLGLLLRYDTLWQNLFHHRGKVLAGALALALAGGWVLAKATDRDFESSGELDEFVIFVELSSGVKLDVANAVIREVESRLNKDPHVAHSVLTAVARIEGWSSKLYITLRPRAERPLSTTQVIDHLRKELDNVGRDVDENAFVHFSSPQTGREMTVQIQGPDYGVMEQLAQEITGGLETIRGLADVKMRFRPGRPQVNVHVDPDRAARRGLTVDEVVDTVHGQVRGLRATLLRTRSTQTEVIVRLRASDREKMQTLVDLPLLTRRGDRVRLGEVATLQVGQMPNEVFRENKQRLLQITANRDKISLSRAAEEILRVLEQIKFPRDYFASLAGDYKETMRGFRQLSWGLLAMLVAVYLVLVILFESIVQPLVIMATVPLCLIGAAWGLAILGLPLSTGVMVGLMMLGGIVVNNGIMLLDHFNRHSPVGTGLVSTASETKAAIPCDHTSSVKPEAYGEELESGSGEAQLLWDALRAAALARRRPILLTAGSAILGFLPLMLDTSETGALWRPLSAAMVFGLLVSTILTLYVVPCLTFALKQDVPRLLHRPPSPLHPLDAPRKLLQLVHNFFFKS